MDIRRMLGPGRSPDREERRAGRHPEDAGRRRRSSPRRSSTGRALILPLLMVATWLALGGVLGPLAGKLGDVAESGSAAYLPQNAEATEALELNSSFEGGNSLPGIVVFARAEPLSEADLDFVEQRKALIDRHLQQDLAGPVTGPFPSEDGEAVQLVVPFAGTDMYEIAPSVEELRELLRPPSGLSAHVAGPAGVQADLDSALGAIDIMLVLITAAIILVILIAVYRSPVLPFVVLAVAGTALGVANGLIYLLARADLLSMGAEAQGILSVLVLGCATDYALLLVARYREQLQGPLTPRAAMAAAWRASVEPIVASAATVAFALLCLLVSDLGLNRGLGPAAAIGVGCAMVAMLTFLPALLLLFGRTVFWPRAPQPTQSAPAQGGIWRRVCMLVDRFPRMLWICVTLGLVALSLGAMRLDADGIPESEMIIADDVDSKLGQQILGDHFPAGAGNPALVFYRVGASDQVLDSARELSGVAAVDQPADGSGQQVVGGYARAAVVLADPPESEQAKATVQRLRAELRTIPGADAKVGGYTAVELDFDESAAHDRIAMPLIGLVAFVLLVLLLRSLVAPLLLLGTVVLSFLASLGVSAFVFQDVLGFPGVDSTFPLHAFVFLVALGVDYNIFLMTRVREEAAIHGTRQGMLRGLAATGGVITSAGVVLATTFAALALVPLVLMVELAFTVAFGVLLDTFIVRSLLLPALVVDVGPRTWWPSRLAREPSTDPATQSPRNRPTSGSGTPAASSSQDQQATTTS